MMMAAGKVSLVLHEAEGVDEVECLQALEALVNDRFGELE